MHCSTSVYTPADNNERFLQDTDLAEAIQLARSNGLTTIKIVRALSANMAYADVLVLARRAAPQPCRISGFGSISSLTISVRSRYEAMKVRSVRTVAP